MFKEVALAGGVEKAGNEKHTHTHTSTRALACRCIHIPDASLDSVTSHRGAGFDGAVGLQLKLICV